MTMKNEAKAKSTAVLGGGKVGRYEALPMPTLTEVTMADVPQPPMDSYRGKYEAVWERILALRGDRAVCAVFAHERQAKAVKASFKKKAKAIGKFLSTSRSHDGLTWYFWLEKA
jgi:hypothetical protein